MVDGSASARTETKAARTRRRILDAAAATFASHGYAATGLADIAAAADMQAGSLYFHFGSKDELITEVLAEGVERSLVHVQAALDAVADDASAATRLEAAVRAHLDAVDVLSGYAAAVLTIIDQVSAEVRAAHAPRQRPYRDLWLTLIADAQDAGALPRSPPAPLLLGLLFGAMNASARSQWRYDSPTTAEALIALIGLGRTPDAPAS